MGRGDGTFGPVTLVPGVAGFRPNQLAVADLNGDGRQDFILEAFAPFDESSTVVSTFMGNGNGTFELTQCIFQTVSLTGMATGDLNGDGKTDLVLSGGFAILQNFLGNGDGTLQPPVTSDVPHESEYLAVGDFNDDGNLDVVAGSIVDSSLSVYLGNGDGTLRSPSFVPVATGGRIAVARFNSDGNLDVMSSLIRRGPTSLI